jgi:hypothetical protein
MRSAVVIAPFIVLIARPSSSYAPIRWCGGYCHSSALYLERARAMRNLTPHVLPACYPSYDRAP